MLTNAALRERLAMATIALLCWSPHLALATESGYQLPPNTHYLMAQTDPDEAFDPFSDYSEFDEASDEEADINFFRNGRFFSVALAAGPRTFTGNFAQEYGSGLSYGFYVTYFFDLRMAFSMGYIMGNHSVAFTTNNETNRYSGSVALTNLSFDFKYYLNTQNMTRGIANLSPYTIIGLGNYSRTYSLDNYDGSNTDSAMGLNLGAGIEIPMMRRKSFLGLQAVYHAVSFADESKQYVSGSERLDQTLSGDYISIMAILGLNF